MARNLLRFILLLAVAFAVPLQGFAAASAGVCMSLGHHQGGDAHDSHQHDGADNSHCPPCVSCCTAATIAPAIEPPLPQAALAVPQPSAQHFIAAGVPERLDRPPLAL